MLKKILVTVAMVGLALPAIAALEGSHHDSKVMLASSDGRCFFCHGLKQTTSYSGTAGAELGTVGPFCIIRCHQGSGVFTGYGTINGPDVWILGQEQAGSAGAQNVSSYLNSTAYKGHPVGGSSGAATIPSPDVSSSSEGMQLTNFPYSSNGVIMQCTSCHAVHDNDKGAPFLWAPLSFQANGTAAAVGDLFCQKCHNKRSDVAGTDSAQTLPSAMGSHPVEVNFAIATASARTVGSGGRRGRTLLMDVGAVNGNILDVDASSGADANFDAKDNSWVLGGHVGDLVGAVSQTKSIGCYTCHVIHGGGYNERLLAAPMYDVTTGTSDLCEKCHGAGAASNNPGITAYYHPVGTQMHTDGTASYTSSTGNLVFAISIPTGSDRTVPGPEDVPLSNYVQFSGDPAGLLCLTCHDVHGAQPTVGGASFMALQDFKFGDTNQPKYICGVCHNASDSAAAKAHHKTLTGDWSSYNPTWVADYTGVTLADGLDCTDCHIVNPGGRPSAHNWQ